MQTQAFAPKLVTEQPRHLELTEEQWIDLRNKLVQYIPASDGEFEYTFRCDTPAELWRARTLQTKEEGTVNWIRSVVKPGDVFYDIGANIGLYTLLSAARVEDHGMVYAFEPHVGNVQSLLHNVSGNNLTQRVKVLSCALNDREGFFDFNYCHAAPGSSMSQLNDVRDAGGSQFQPVYSEYKYATTIDLLIQRGMIRPADHIKMDVDGNEMLILRGMRDYLASSRAPRTLQVEINTRYKQELYAFMRACHYGEPERHDTQHGKQAIEKGHNPESIGYNAIFRRAA